MSGRLLTNQAYSPRSFSKSNTRMTCCRTGRCLNCVCVCVPSTFHSDLETVLIPLKLPIAPNDMPVQPLIVPNITPSNRLPESPSHSPAQARGCNFALPQFIPPADPADPLFTWGEYDCVTFFKVPHGNAGKPLLPIQQLHSCPPFRKSKQKDHTF